MNEPITSIGEFEDWIADQLRNTPETPYTVAVNVKYLRGGVTHPGSLGSVLTANKAKYISLDLSGSLLPVITDNAFEGCSGLVGIVFPAEATAIGEEAFSGCISLTTVAFSTGLTAIGTGAFSDCTSITSLIIPHGVTRVGDYAFSSCSSLVHVTIPAGAARIGDYAFSSCSSLAEVDLPASVVAIGERAFSRCKGLTHITIPGGVAFIGEEAFNDCDGLTSVTFKKTLLAERWGPRAFAGDLRDAFYAVDSSHGTPGTYTRPNGKSKTWTKQ